MFGRDAGSDVVVAGSEVSRRHAEIQTTPEGYVLVDLSVNGTFVNGERIGRQYLLARADVIRIGNDEFRFYADSARRTAPVRTSPAAARRPAAHSDRAPAHGCPTPCTGCPLTVPPRESPPPVAAAGRSRSRPCWCGAARCEGGGSRSRCRSVNIGRADYNDLVIADPSVSTTHAKLQRKDDVWILTDLGSTNGTFVEGEPVTGETALTPGTTLRFGDVAALFEPHDEPQPGAASASRLEAAAAGVHRRSRAGRRAATGSPADPGRGARAQRDADVADRAAPGRRRSSSPTCS